MAEKLARPDLLGALGVGAAALSVYGATLCPTIYTSGAGENATAVLTLGVPHPPGFPLFCLAGKLFTMLLPLGEPAWRVNLFSAACGAASSAMLFVALRLLLGPRARAAAAAAALLFAFSRTFWSQAVIAEVYTCNALLQILGLVCALSWTRGRALWPAGLVFGLGIAVHPLSLLFAPAWLSVLVSSRRSVDRRGLLAAAIAMAAGAALHLYAPIRSRADPVLDWGDPETWDRFVAYITAAQYRGRMFGVAASEVLPGARRALAQLAHETTPWLLPCPAIGAWVLARTHRALAAGLAAAAAITFVYAVNYDIPWEIDVYFIPVVLAMTIAAAAGLERLGALLGGGAAALPAIALLPLIAGYHLNDRSRHTIVEAYGRDILACAPQGATVIAPETDAAFALLYLTTVRGERPDVTVWVNTAEGARPLARALAPTVRPVPLERVAAESRAPVVLCEPPPPRSGIGLEIEPSGVVYRVASRRVPSAPPFDFSRFALDAIVRSGPPFALDDRSRIILSKYLFARGDARRLGGDRDAAHNDYDAAAMRAPDAAETWIDLASRQEALGDPAAAIASVQRGLALRDDAMFENRLARLLIDAGRRDEAMAALRRAIAIDPDLAIAHSNLGGLLGMRGDGTGAVRELEIAVRLDPESSMAAKNLAQAYMMVGDRRRAAEAIQRAIALHPGQPDLLAIRAAIGDR